MADRGWTARVITAAGAAAATGAAQLGLGYGLGVVVWPLAAAPDDSVWLGSLGWATWITASATVCGAVTASRLGGGPARRPGGPWRLALAASAGVGALVAVALIALAARSAVRADTFSPQVIAAGYAVIGLLLGVVVAYWAVVSRPVSVNLLGTGLWLWTLAVGAVLVELTLHRRSAAYLTSWQFAAGDHRYGTIFWPSAALNLGAALLIGAVSAVPAARRGHLGTGAATSGAVGPLLIAVAFLALAPQLAGTPSALESAYLIAPYAVLAGLAGSVLTVAVARKAMNRRAVRGLAVATGVAPVRGAEAETTLRAFTAATKAKAVTAGSRKLAGRDRPGRVKRTAPADGPPGTGVDPTTPTSADGSATPADGPTTPAGGTTQAGALNSDSATAVPTSTTGPTPTTGPRSTAGPTSGAGGDKIAGGRGKAADGRLASATNGAAAGTGPADTAGTATDLTGAGADAEIAVAARPRTRAKKAAPGRKLDQDPAAPGRELDQDLEDKYRKPTVTPPPARPAVAEINPQRPPAD